MSQEIPPQLLSALHAAKGFDEKSFMAVHESGDQVVSVRLNPEKAGTHLMTAGALSLIQDKVPWSSNGYYLSGRPSFTLDPLFHGGVYYVQEASSMFLETALRQSCDLSQPLRVLDLCAAPGGKSTLIQSLISPDSLLVSNEIIKARASILVETLTKWGAANVVVTNNDVKDFERLPEFFDVIVVDAPCSGSGLFRKDPRAINEWSTTNVFSCRDRQRRILSGILNALKPGGTLIYSTCSFSIEEDEEICEWLVTEHLLLSHQVTLDEAWGIVETSSASHGAFGYRFYPDKVKGEGFFLAVFQKPGAPKEVRELHTKQKMPGVTKSEMATVNRYIQNPGDCAFIKWNDVVLAIPLKMYNSFLQVQGNLYLKKAGIKLGTVVRDELIPDHELTMSTLMSDVVLRIEVEEEIALNYLRRKDIKINADATGWAIITYKQCALGLVKILPNRVNNYYPREWRILNM